MKVNRLKIFLLLASNMLIAMDAPTSGKRKFEESESSEQRAAKAPALQEEEITQASALQELPNELKVLILHYLATGNSAQEIGRNIRSLAATNKYFNGLLNNIKVTQWLINTLADKYFAGDRGKAAQALGTRAAQEWLDKNSYRAMPRDIHGLILQALVGASSPEESRKAFENLAQTNKAFNEYINNPQTLSSLINYIIKFKKIPEDDVEGSYKALQYLGGNLANTLEDIWKDIIHYQYKAVRKKLLALPLNQLELFATQFYWQLFGEESDSGEIDRTLGIWNKNLQHMLLPYIDPYSSFGGNTTLAEAIIAKQYETAEQFLKRGVDPNEIHTVYEWIHDPILRERFIKLLKAYGAVDTASEVE